MNNIKKERIHILWDIAFLAASIGAAVWLDKSGLIEKFIFLFPGHKVLTVFIAGMFLPFAFTTAPATAVFLTISKSIAPSFIFLMALVGGLGALFGDFVIFRFAKDRVSEDLNYILNLKKHQRLAHIFHLKMFRFMTPLFGVIAIATPLPDELGVALLGLAKITGARFATLTFLIHATAIAIIGLFA